MDKTKITELYKKYKLQKEDVFNHKHYLIITRSGIEKIQAEEKIEVTFQVERCEENFSAVKATGIKPGIPPMETFGSALYGGKIKDEVSGRWVDLGNTTSRYILEIAEKRALARVVLKLAGLYQEGVMSEDESEEFKRDNKPKPVAPSKKMEMESVPSLILQTFTGSLAECKTEEDLKNLYSLNKKYIEQYPSLKVLLTNKKNVINGK